MLYVTTRNKYDAYTVPRTLHSDRGADGGFYQPFRLPMFEAEEIRALGEKSFSQCVADILNLFFPCRLSSWDVEFCVGRYPARIVSVSSRILVAEIWHNLDSVYTRLEKNLAARICGTENSEQKPSSWVSIAIRIAVLFGIFSELQRTGVTDPQHPVDIAVPSGDFSAPMSAWYARAMGLPIANILCSCNENSAVWDLLHLGELNTGGVAVRTTTPEGDYVVPENLERLIYNTLGVDDTLRYCAACSLGGVYAPDQEAVRKLRQGMFAAVVSRTRLNSVISNVHRTTGYILGPYEALAYGGLMDYRAKTGESRPALLLAERSPACDGALVADAMNISVQELSAQLNLG